MAPRKAFPLPDGREIKSRFKVKLDAPPEAIYDVLANIPTHLEWAGKRIKKNFRLTSIDGGESAAGTGSAWASTGEAPDGTFQDRSVVTHATRPRTFEFKTESHVTLTQRMTRATDLGGAKMLLNPILGRVGQLMMSGMIKPALKNLGAMAGEGGRPA